MKKLATMILLISLLLMSIVPTAMANTISAGDYVYLTGYNSTGNGGIMTYTVSHNGTSFSYDTFCIQDNVYVYPKTWYPVANVSTNVGYFAPNAPPAGAGPLKGAVDYLFAQFASGVYNVPFYTDPNAKANQYDFQATLWSLQGSGPSHIPVAGTPWANDLAYYNSNYANLPDLSWGTEVINIVSSMDSSGKFYGPDIQNQLYHSVPEPATMLLLGFGLIGLAGVGRKFKK